MAGKADLVNGIADSVEPYVAKLAHYDGWGQAEAADGGDASSPAPAGTLVDPFGGG